MVKMSRLSIIKGLRIWWNWGRSYGTPLAYQSDSRWCKKLCSKNFDIPNLNIDKYNILLGES